MKNYLLFIGLLTGSCQLKQERFLRTADAFPVTLIGQWEARLPGRGSQVFHAGLSVEPSGDSLLWNYFSQVVDTAGNGALPCGPQVQRMPIWWDDSLQLAQANHGVGQGFGFDFLRLTKNSQLQMNSPSIAPDCRGPLGFNASQLLFTKVHSFRYKP